jgi:hypothetical protein
MRSATYLQIMTLKTYFEYMPPATYFGSGVAAAGLAGNAAPVRRLRRHASRVIGG